MANTSTNGLGRRKTAVARVFLKPGTGVITINSKPADQYVSLKYLLDRAVKPLHVVAQENNFDVNINVKGGGIKGQTEAISLGIARALIKIDEANKPALKAEKLTTRDPRMVERKKFGKKKARKSFQFSKR
ncbi:MAG TPA: 30S ribosomal protein S9 [Chitinophagales bacterium]|nr:30S ribosomal protein S9 [Chitinophagales bacterium]MCB9075632.1 30S ribosomal protein S9 [Chitinophagales bacterium]HMU98480.1 30S ribosomal protein S9 [Chitinophagales bacterium]HMV02537.1 30S ribosomal protein S9 [Chitinophagales bacterium]HMW95086.1 30S ribosomal protein S9 [Chitinophagales bacterium]